MQNKEIINKTTSILLLNGKPSSPSEGYIGPIITISGKKRKDKMYILLARGHFNLIFLYSLEVN